LNKLIEIGEILLKRVADCYSQAVFCTCCVS